MANAIGHRAHMIEHELATDVLGDVTVMVPEEWDDGLGFMLRSGVPGDQPLVRIQSRCAYGEVFGSQHCDCRAQLMAAAALVQQEGGYIVYLDQEGRGAGSAAKAAAYRAEQQERVDSFSHYERTGLPADLRTYDRVAAALLDLGVLRVRLLTNNPDKLRGLIAGGVEAERVPLVVAAHSRADEYLAAKRMRGHLL